MHFTPEHVGSYEWEQIRNADSTVDMKFGVKEDAVAKELLMIADQHRLILRVFDRCLNRQLLEQAEVKQVAQRAVGQYKYLVQREGFPEQAIAVGESW